MNGQSCSLFAIYIRTLTRIGNQLNEGAFYSADTAISRKIVGKKRIRARDNPER